MRALLVANPAATTTTRKVRDVLVRALSSELQVEVVETERRGHARELAAQATTDGIDVVVTLGGDGTVNEAANGLLAAGPGPRVPMLAVVPGGSTNVFARALGRSRDPVEATGEILDSLRAGRTRLVSLGTASARTSPAAPAVGTDDAGWTDPRWFVFAAGLGFDADVISRVEAQRARGRRSSGALYVRSGVDAFLLGRDRRRPPVTLELPGRAPVDGLFLALVSNVSPWTYLGARPIVPSPEASFDTGLDVFAMGRVGIVRMLHHLRQTMAAQPDARGRGVHRWHDLPELTLSATRPQGWQLDGDHLGTTTGLRLRSVPEALRVVV
ncbi:diacylglycerol kinase family protein [Modestobacter sp. VKM Ac-2986]|uniref:diacylglycerol/lipid kinase family protein n=1 Tax=Modestobacter sp. VKM Ac-2986 TaxID=3004140 RepID=UPI0022AB9E75|nr:diacylglycerol kinase family protein [Modestobacter sp. VKM Ac-2986]MCZ2829613.1 diacylglycerol kinase family protein [Modestobacter sp. VKM Ac-2986]